MSGTILDVILNDDGTPYTDHGVHQLACRYSARVGVRNLLGHMERQIQFLREQGYTDSDAKAELDDSDLAALRQLETIVTLIRVQAQLKPPGKPDGEILRRYAMDISE